MILLDSFDFRQNFDAFLVVLLDASDRLTPRRHRRVIRKIYYKPEQVIEIFYYKQEQVFSTRVIKS